jgi:MFS family permease
MGIIARRAPAMMEQPYRRVWFATMACDGGYQLMILAQGWLIFELTGSALQLGILGAAIALPNILMTLIGGVIADRFGKKRILMVTSLISGLLLLLLTGLDQSGHIAVWHVLTITALISLVTGLNWPAQVSILPELVPRESMINAVALTTVIWQGMRMLMPVAGGLLLVWTDTSVLLFLAALGSFIMSGVMVILPVQDRTVLTESPLQQLQGGLRYIWDNPMFRWILILTFTGMLFTQSIIQIGPVLAELLGRAEVGYGVLISATGIGSVVGTLLIGSADQQKRLGLVMLGGATLSVFSLSLFALATLISVFWVAATILFFFSLFASFFLVGSMTVLQLAVPDELRGRVMGIHTISFSLPSLGGLWLGATSQWLSEPLGQALGTASALWLGCLIYLAVIAWVFWRLPVIRDIDGASLAT